MGGIATTIYGIRNFGKANNGDIGRVPAAVAQATNSLGQTVNVVAGKVEHLNNLAEIGTKVGDKAARVSGFASAITNPLLVGAAGVRVMKDEDKESALVEETAAMGGMFAAERMYKIVRNTVKQGNGENLLNETKKSLFKSTSFMGKFENCTKKLDTITLKNTPVGDQLEKLGKEISKQSKGKQKLIFIVAELGLVATSILSYSAFKKLGQKITGRDDQTKVNETIQNEQPNKQEEFHQPAFASLTTHKV